MEVTLFTQPNCAPCRLTKRMLEKHGITYTEKPAQTQPTEIQNHWRKQGFTQAPIIHATHGGFTYEWAGYNREKIQALAKVKQATQ